jgi:hypothetical protein
MWCNLNSLLKIDDVFQPCYQYGIVHNQLLSVGLTMENKSWYDEISFPMKGEAIGPENDIGHRQE